VRRPFARGGFAAALVLTALAVAPRLARAQQDFAAEASAVEGEDTYNRYRSPQKFAFELTFGPYRPDVDSEFNGKRQPYDSYYGSGHDLLTRIEFDYQFWHRYGSLAAGLGVGYFSVTANSPVANGTGAPSGDQSQFKVIPLSLSAIYRFDYFIDKVPLVPFGKLGLDWAYWQITDGNGNIATDGNGGVGRGGTLGWHVAGGLALVLDFLDPDASHDFDQDLGVNHTAITFEFFHADISGLGQSNRLHVGDNDWTLGLLLEF
jgi:hypothetical protein